MEPIEGIVLQVHSFDEASHLLILFSKEHGVVKTSVRSQKRSGMRSFSPLLLIQGVITKSAQEIWKSRDLAVVNTFSSLRTSYEKLEMAALACKAIKKALPMQLALPQIYELFYTFLSDLHRYREAKTALAKLFIEIMIVEGLHVPESLQFLKMAQYDTAIDIESFRKAIASFESALHVQLY